MESSFPSIVQLDILEMPVYKRSPFSLSCRILKSCRSTHDVTEPLHGLWKLQNVLAVNKQVNKSWPWTNWINYKKKHPRQSRVPSRNHVRTVKAWINDHVTSDFGGSFYSNMAEGSMRASTWIKFNLWPNPPKWRTGKYRNKMTLNLAMRMNWRCWMIWTKKVSFQ